MDNIKGLRSMIEAKFGREIKTSDDCNNLAEDITATTGEPISATTLKRLFTERANEGTVSEHKIAILRKYVSSQNLNFLVKTANGSAGGSCFCSEEDMKRIFEMEGVEFPSKPKTMPIEDMLESIERIKSTLPNQQEKDYFQNKMDDICHMVYPHLFPAVNSESARKEENLTYSIADDFEDAFNNIEPKDPYITAKYVFDRLSRLFGNEATVVLTPSIQTPGCNHYEITVNLSGMLTAKIKIFLYGYTKCVFYTNNGRITYYKSLDAIEKEPNMKISDTTLRKVVASIIKSFNPDTNLVSSDI